MHNQDNNRQSLNDNPEQEAFIEPSWVRPVKVAVVVMGVLIVVCLGLLGYGLSTGMGKLATTGDAPLVFSYPENSTLIETSATADGVILMRFSTPDQMDEIVIINPASQKIISRVQLKPAENFSFAE